MRRPIVAGNWKMNGSRHASAALMDAIAAGMSGVDATEVVVCPPSILVPLVMDHARDTGILCGGQNLDVNESGAFTGEISGVMLRDFGCTYCIVGHSERRTLFGESSELVAHKFERAQACGLTPILCIGETLEQRRQERTREVIAAQLDAVIQRCGVRGFENAVIAYEPVWAIGTGLTASPAQAQEIHAFIRTTLAAMDAAVADGVRIQYGGSVKPDNARELFAQADIDGGLIGGASLDAGQFLSICGAI